MIITEIFRFRCLNRYQYSEKGDGKWFLNNHYKIEVSIEGVINENGVIIDRDEFREVIKLFLDHKFALKDLRDVLDIPTPENLLLFIVERLSRSFNVIRMKLWENENVNVEWYKPDERIYYKKEDDKNE